MKKLSILLLSAVALISTFSACSSDDDKKPAGPSIIGKWEWSQIITYTGTTPDGDPIAWPAGLSNLNTDGQCGAADLINFTNDAAKAGTDAPSGSKNAIYTDSYTDATHPTCTVADINIGYKLSGQTLTIYDVYNTPAVYSIVSLTETELRINIPLNDGTGSITYILVRK